MGCRFRLHGRDPATGLDCIGVLATALGAIGRDVAFPADYALRSMRDPPLEEIARAHGLAATEGAAAPGDVLGLRPSPVQFHLAIVARDPGRLVEAHLGLRRVVLSPRSPALSPIGHWRLIPA